MREQSAKQATEGERASAFLQDKPIRVLFSGYVFESTGYGAAARSYVHALHRAGLDLAVHNRSPKGWRPAPSPLCESLLNRPVEPEFHICHSEPGDMLLKQRVLFPLVALTTWESDTLPPLYASALNQVREVWTPSRYNAEVFRSELKVPVFQLPHAVTPPPHTLVSTDFIDKACNLAADDYVCLLVATWQERKNICGAIEAFLRAFPDQPNVKLLIKTTFGFTSAQKTTEQIVRMLKTKLPQVPQETLPQRLRVFEMNWPEEHMEALTRRAQCYISLHRGEGWCYPLFDAACAGVPVVATGYSGPMDYLDPRYHHLTRYELVPVDRGDDPKNFPFSPNMRWAQPDAEHAAEQLRQIYENYAQARSQAEAGARILRAQYSFEAVGKIARERLLAVREENRSRHWVSVTPSAASLALKEGGPMPIKLAPPEALSAD